MTAGSAVSGRLRLYLDLVRWNRPAGWLLLLWPSLYALWIAAGGFPGWHLVAVFTLGTVLMRSAGCCVNDVADREFDRHVKRTAQRPVTTGAVSMPVGTRCSRAKLWMRSPAPASSNVASDTCAITMAVRSRPRAVGDEVRPA